MAKDFDLNRYETRLREVFGQIKSGRSLPETFAACIPLPEAGGYLQPLAEFHAADKRLIETLSAWRSENSIAYPTQFPVTNEGTERWVRRLLDTEDRVLFLILDPCGYRVGQIGYGSCLHEDGDMEIENVVRGVKTAAPGIMSLAMRGMLAWAEELIQPCGFFLKVFQDNDHAVAFYRKLGFADAESTPLRRHVEGQMVAYRPLAGDDTRPPDKSFLKMVYHSEAP